MFILTFGFTIQQTALVNWPKNPSTLFTYHCL